MTAYRWLGRSDACERNALDRIAAEPNPESAAESPGHRPAMLLRDVDVRDLDRVVSVAESVPGWDVGLDVADGVGCASAQAVSTDAVCLPVEGPVLPLGGVSRGLELRTVPLTFAGEADVHCGHRSGA